MGWSGNLKNVPLDAAGKPQDTLAVLWYAYSPEWKAWRVLPAISERVKPEYYAQGHPSLFYSVLQASDARICLQSGTYRAEFYVDGELTDSKANHPEDENLKPVMFPDLNVAFCHPASWKRWQSQDPDAVWTRGYIEEGNNRGAFVFSFFDPQQDGEEKPAKSALRRAENILHNEGLAPEPATPRRSTIAPACNGHPGETDGGVYRWRRCLPRQGVDHEGRPGECGGRG